MKVKVNGIPDVIIDDRYLRARKLNVQINQVGNVLVNIHVRADDDGLIDLYTLLHIEAGDVEANPSKSKADLSSALDWSVEKLRELREFIGLD
jgi:hypothetical protein